MKGRHVPFRFMLGKDFSIRMSECSSNWNKCWTVPFGVISYDSNVYEASQIELLGAKLRHGSKCKRKVCQMIEAGLGLSGDISSDKFCSVDPSCSNPFFI